MSNKIINAQRPCHLPMLRYLSMVVIRAVAVAHTTGTLLDAATVAAILSFPATLLGVHMRGALLVCAPPFLWFFLPRHGFSPCPMATSLCIWHTPFIVVSLCVSLKGLSLVYLLLINRLFLLLFLFVSSFSLGLLLSSKRHLPEASRRALEAAAAAAQGQVYPQDAEYKF